MNALIDAFVNRPRPVLTIMVLLLIAGLVSYITIPKEAEPDIPIPQMYVNIAHEGISPEDSERMLIRPMETELRSLEGLKELRATASEGSGVLIMEFEAGFDADEALTDVREKVDLARNELPSDSEEPFVQEVNIALFPILVVMLHGDVPERTLVSIARDLRDKIEALPGVLDAEVAGDREELLEVIVDPVALASYNLSFTDLVNYVNRNNRLVAAGALDSGQGRFSVKVPGVIEDLDDLLNMPIKTDGLRTVVVGDVATVRRTYKDPDGFARLNGNSAIGLEISKRSGANIIEVVDAVTALVRAEQAFWPANLEVTITQDNSEQVRTMLNDLVNNVAIAVLLVMVVILAVLGLRSAGLVGISIPGSFLSGILIINMMGYSMNIVVLFSLIMAVGMLVDGAIVVTELAERNLANGYSPKLAYSSAAKRMAWPIISSTATTLAAFMPLLFWPGLVGEFMKYLPITLLVTLAMSLVMALLFVPTFGSLLRGKNPAAYEGVLKEAETDLLAEARATLDSATGAARVYLDFIRRVVSHPFKVLGVALLILFGTIELYDAFGRGVEFFPAIEPEVAQLNIHARGDLSVLERDALVREVEQRILDMPEYESVYTRSGIRMGNDTAEDIIGRIQLQLVEWNQRRPAAEIMEEVRERTADLAGIAVEPQVQESGITSGKPIQIELSSLNTVLLNDAVAQLRAGMEELGGFIDITDNRPLPGIDWRIEVDRQEAARFGTDISNIGSAIQLVTNGILLGDYRPDNADDEVDIRVRFPDELRNLSQLDRLTVNTIQGNIPLGNFMERVAAPRVGNLERTDGTRVMKVAADVEEGLLVDEKVQELQAWLAAGGLDPAINVVFKGEDQDQREAEEFLTKAFGVALFMMALILVTQFNSFYQTFLILTAVVFSIVGVLLGLLITDQPFGIVMAGIGVISLAGIVVNNNIVLIDTFNLIHKQGASASEAVVLTCAQRLRPVMLTTVTTILGLMPMAIGMNFDLVNRVIEFGSPSTQWWTQLATAVAGGLAFATLLTLVLTPCMLVAGESWERIRQGRRKGQAALSGA
jgi:multidrug efflux pump